MMLSSALLPAPTNMLFALVAFSVFALQRSAITTTTSNHGDVVATSMRRQMRAAASTTRTGGAYPKRVIYMSIDSSAGLQIIAGRKRRRLDVQSASSKGRRSSFEEPVGSDAYYMYEQPPSIPLPMHPTCNNIHELDMNSKSMVAFPNDNGRSGSDGLLRWKRITKDLDKKEMAVKTLHWHQQFDVVTYRRRRMDAVISDHLSSSKFIINVHDYCGMATMNRLDDTTHRSSLLESDLSTYTTEKRIAVAKNMARSVAELHESAVGGLDKNTIVVHGAITPDSFSIVGTKVRLGDFDSAQFVLKPTNTTMQEDLHGLGLAIYTIMTGLYPQSQQPAVPEADLESKDRYVRAMVAAVNITTRARRTGSHGPSASDILALLKDSEDRFCDQRPLFKSSETCEAVELYFNETSKTFAQCSEEADSYRLRIVLSANMAYEEDFLNWFAHSSDAGLLDDKVRVVLYAEDENMYNAYANSTRMEVKKSWEVGQTKWNDSSLSGAGRFSYSEKKSGFGQLVSRRGSVLVEEANLAKNKGERLLFMDLDVMLLGDPRSFFCGNFDLWGQDASSLVTGPFNSGLLAMRPTSRMIATLEMWRDLLESQKEAGSNQKLFNDAVRNASAGLGLQSKILPRQLFPAGRHVQSKKFKTCLGSQVIHGANLIAYHNNWCSEARNCHKAERARKLGLWKPVERAEVM